MGFIEEHLWIIVLSIFAIVTYAKVWYLIDRVEQLEKKL